MVRKFSKIGQHLFIGVAGTELVPASRRLLNTIQPGGVVLFARNCESEVQLRRFCETIHNEFPFRPLVGIDQENGRVNRLREIVGDVPTIAQLKQSARIARVQMFGRETGRWLHRLHIDVNFAPVFDLELFDKETNNALQERCWGRSADEVSRWAGAFVDGMERQGIAACPKHFPGLGGATVDSHDHLPTIRRTRQQILEEDARPYGKCIERLTMIMVGHGHYPAFDGPKPLAASMSPNIVTRLLRGQLGYPGLIVTDDMEMGAVAQLVSVGHAVVEAFRAGADMILVCHSAAKALAAHEALVKAAETGDITDQRFRESAERIERFHSKWTAHCHAG